MHMVVCVCACVMCVLATGLVLKRACKEEAAPSLASSLPSRKLAGCTKGERDKHTESHCTENQLLHEQCF